MNTFPTHFKETQSKVKSKFVFPFLNTSFGINLQILLSLWPIWWILGIEQLLLPVFLAAETVRFLIQSRGQFYINRSIQWAFGLAIWWILPILWVERSHLDIFFKEMATAYSQVLILLLAWNTIRTPKTWNRIFNGLNILAIYIAVTSLIFISKIFVGKFTSVLGLLLPHSLVQSSAFFQSIAQRNLGSFEAHAFINPMRLNSLTLGSGSLSLICLLLIPLIYWNYRYLKGLKKAGQGLLVFALIVTLFFTKSRVAYVAFAFQLLAFFIFQFGLHRKRNIALLFALVILSSVLIILIGFLMQDRIFELFRVFFVEFRSGSWRTRLVIYQETLRLLTQHPIIGWGQPINIEYLRSVFSAGTHSSYLGMLFQHGVIGLLLYLGLWISIWRTILKAIKRTSTYHQKSLYYFWVFAAIAMLGFNIREAAGNWWWDQMVTITLWSTWALITTAPKVFQNQSI